MLKRKLTLNEQDKFAVQGAKLHLLHKVRLGQVRLISVI